MYLNAVIDAFADEIDYAQLVKLYGGDLEGQKRYSPAQWQGSKKTVILGDPDPVHISTSYVERQNHIYSVALFYMHYNFVRIHQSLRVTPAMAAGVTGKLWSIHDIVMMTENRSVAAAA